MIVIWTLGALAHPVEALVEFGEVVDLGAEEIGLVLDGLGLRVRRHVGSRRPRCRWGRRRSLMRKASS